MFWKIIFWLSNIYFCVMCTLFIRNDFKAWGLFYAVIILLCMVAIYQLAWNKILVGKKYLKILFWSLIVPCCCGAFWVVIYNVFRWCMFGYETALYYLPIAALVVIPSIIGLTGFYLSAYNNDETKPKFAGKILAALVVLSVLILPALSIYIGRDGIKLQKQEFERGAVLEILRHKDYINEVPEKHETGYVIWGDVENKTYKTVDYYVMADVYDKNGVKLSNESFSYNGTSIEIVNGKLINYLEPRETKRFSILLAVCKDGKMQKGSIEAGTRTEEDSEFCKNGGFKSYNYKLRAGTDLDKLLQE